MSRYSPQVLPQDGPDMGALLVQAFMNHRQAKREKTLEDRQDQRFAQEQEEYEYRKSQRPAEERRVAEEDAVRSAALHDEGFRRGDEVEHTSRPAPVTGAVVTDLQGQEVKPVDPRYERYEGGLYRDPNETPLARELRKQQAVFSQVQQADPEDYPSFVPGMDYTKELQSVLTANRNLERDAARAKATDARTESIQSHEDARARANRDAADRRAEADRRARTEAATGKPEEKRASELRAGLIAKHGKPASELQQDVLDALAEGETRESILAGLRRAGAPAARINEAADYLHPEEY